MLLLLLLHSGPTVVNQELTQEFLELNYKRSEFEKTVRFHEGRFEWLTSHKWREAKDGGNWDDKAPWKSQWVPFYDTQLIVHKLSIA